MIGRIGRKSATMTYLCIRVVGFSLATFAPNYPTCVVGRFILGVGSSGCFLCAYVLGELTSAYIGLMLGLQFRGRLQLVLRPILDTSKTPILK